MHTTPPAGPNKIPTKSLHQNIAIVAFLCLPLVIVTGLCVLIARSLSNPNIHKMPAIGAGAGQTGGANALSAYVPWSHGAEPAKANMTPVVRVDDSQPAGEQAHAAAGNVNPVTLSTGFMLVVSDKAGKSSASSPIYMASQMSNWSPNDERFKFTAQSDMRWRLHVTKEMLQGSPSTVEFKLTRGSWDLEELNSDFTVPGNKQLPMLDPGTIKPGEPPMIEFTVAQWSDTSPNSTSRHVGDEYRSIPATGTLRRLQVRGGVGDAEGKSRDLLVWLPEGYDAPVNASRSYPVLYMHDGQNLFEKAGIAPAEWRFDETMTELLVKHMIEPCIVVGIPHSGATRAIEYLPPVTDKPVFDNRMPLGEGHVAWVLHEVMPRVERAFRVRSGPESTGIGGSSLGALISIYAATQHPEVFGKVLAESPALGYSNQPFWQRVTGSAKGWPRTMFIAVGGNEAAGMGKGTGKGDDSDTRAKSEQFAGWVKDFEAFARTKMPETGRVEFVFEPDATHNEAAWADRLPGAMRFLFPPAP